MRLALVIEYDGTSYHGFQYQVNALSIQEELEKALEKFTGEQVRLKAAGRTDAGVHAKGQVVAFDTESSHSTDTVVRALNFYLPEAIAVGAACRVSEDFDPRRDAVSRRYRYTILNGATRSPLMRRTACLVAEPLNVGRMRRAARLYKGEHDFRRFAAPLDGTASGTVRRIYESSLHEKGDLVAFDVEGSSFLPRQVRRMAGALLDVGRGAMSLAELRSMIDGRDNKPVARALPPHGLCLVKVTYPDFPAEGNKVR